MKLISKIDARTAGLKRYFIGKTCRRGHLVERFVSSGNCVECANKQALAWKKTHRDVCTAASRRWNQANPEKHRANALRNQSKPEQKAKQAVRSRKWMEENREKSNNNSYRWVCRNRPMATAAQTRRRARKLERTCVWADQEKIKSFYIQARLVSDIMGKEYHVDHIIPLAGDNVSGLHVETNLQILEGRLNQSKSNRFIEDLAA